MDKQLLKEAQDVEIAFVEDVNEYGETSINSSIVVKGIITSKHVMTYDAFKQITRYGLVIVLLQDIDVRAGDKIKYNGEFIPILQCSKHIMGGKFHHIECVV